MQKMSPTVEPHAPSTARYAVVMWVRGEPLVYDWCTDLAEVEQVLTRCGREGFVVQERSAQ